MTAGTILHGRRGIKWTDSPACLIIFNTVLPPNGPACADTSSGDFGDQERAVLPPTSYHPGGVVAVMTDGSVRFFSDNINCGNLGAAQPAPECEYALRRPQQLWRMGSTRIDRRR